MIKRILIPIGSFLVLLAGWELVIQSGMQNRAVIPGPWSVYLALLRLAQSGQLETDAVASLRRIYGGLAAGSAMGVVVGLLTGRYRRVGSFIRPVLDLLRQLPPVAIIPLVIAIFGIGEGAKLFSIASAVFFPIWLSTHVGASLIPVQFLLIAQSHRASKWRTVCHVIVPAALPHILSGLRLAGGTAFIMAFVCEMSGASSGLGYRISVAQLAFEMDTMVAAMVALAALGLISDLAIASSFKFVFRWLDKAI